MSRKVLFISIHPDDETLGCAGTILKHKSIGDYIYWLNLTGIVDFNYYGVSEELVLKRNYELKQIIHEYGFEKFFNLNFPTQLLDEIKQRELIADISKVIYEIEPNTIYLTNRSDVHSDHRIAFHAIYACTKNFRYPFIERILMYETLSETEFSPALIENAFIPNVFVDITEFIEKKLEIMKIYKSELMIDNLPRSLSGIKHLAGFRGARIGVDYAEAFMLLFERWL